MKRSRLVLLIKLAFALLLCVILASGDNKYSENANTGEYISDYRAVKAPFRMQKINLLWEKARKKVGNEKLKILFSELKVQDKEELQWKRLIAEGQDKDGLKEAELRKKLRGIMHHYDLTEHFDDTPQGTADQNRLYNEALDKNTNKKIFKDHKLDKLWEKAERSGFTDDELKTLKEEFQHHQEKVDEYHELMDKMSFEDLNELDNSVEAVLDKKKSNSTPDPRQLLKEKHRSIKDDYDRLGKMASSGLENRGFDEERVRELWKLAEKANFSHEELQSLKQELRHYEHRVRKLRHLELEVESVEFHGKSASDDDFEARKRMEQKVKHYGHTVDKMHKDLESRIMQRHLEL